MKPGLFTGQESQRDEVWAFISVNVLLPLMSLKNGHKLLLSLKMQNYDLVLFIATLPFKSDKQSIIRPSESTTCIVSTSIMWQYFQNIDTIQGVCCATRCTDTGKMPISVWEDCRLNRMQDIQFMQTRQHKNMQTREHKETTRWC